MAVVEYRGVRYDTAQGIPWVANGLATLEAKAAVQPSPTKPQADLVAVGLNIVENGTYKAPEGYAYDPISVSVPQPVLSKLEVSANGTYIGKYNEVVVDVPATDIPDEYKEAKEKYDERITDAKFSTNGTKVGLYENPQVLVPTSTKVEVALNITEGGTYSKEPDEGYVYNKVNVDVATAKFTYYPATYTGVFENFDVEVVS